MPKNDGVVMPFLIKEIIDVRKKKRALYISLLTKGYKRLSDTEKLILHNLAMDADIQLLLRNGDTLEIER